MNLKSVAIALALTASLSAQAQHVMDVNVAHGVNFFSVEAFKELLDKMNKRKQDDIVIEDGVIVNED